MTRLVAGGSLLIVLACAGPGLAAQGTQPLRKTDITRLLATPLIPKTEVADLIRRNCLAFRPTERDWADLRAQGADADVLSSVGGCDNNHTAARAATPLLAAPLLAQVAAQVGGTEAASALSARGPAPPVVVTLQPTLLAVSDSSGETPLSVRATVSDSLGNPLPEEPVRLAGEVIEPGSWTATTDSTGTVTFIIPRGALGRAGTIAVLVRGERRANLSILYPAVVSAPRDRLPP